MKQFLLAACLVLVIDIVLTQCANPMSPQGGPKDTIPPTLIESYPVNGVTNFNEQTITLVFSEYINADKLTQNLIITPKSEIRYKHVIKKEQLIIKFEEPFQDSTTFSLNFFDGVTDITEKSPAVNLILAFSTGPFIDSAKVSGHVQDLFTQKHGAKFIVGLYPLTDTLDFLAHNPLYFTTTNDSGQFNMSYIKAGSYKILAFKDDNRNLILDAEEEDHGFIARELDLQDSISGIEINTLLQNVKPIELINHRAIGSYHEIRFNKYVSSYTINPDSINSNIVGENNNTIRLYKPDWIPYNDSLPLIVTARDSLFNKVNDTIKISFIESNRKPQEFKYSVNYKNLTLVDNPTYQLSFNKPIKLLRKDLITFTADSTFSYSPDSITESWNPNRTKLTLHTYLNKDAIYNQYESSLPQDTVVIDSISVPPPIPSPITFKALKGAFVSIENDSTQESTITHKKSVKQEFGTLKLAIQTDKPSYIVQLLQGDQVHYQSINDPTPTYLVKPATYTIRVLIDTNNDGEWSYGNLIENKEPEQVYLFDEPVSVRENWIVEDIKITF